jgi:tRNA acetyltransferase TAN1
MLWTRLLFLQFYEDMVDGKGSDEKPKGIPDKPLNKKIKFEDSDSSDDEDEDHSDEEADNGNGNGNGNDVEKGETAPAEQQQEVLNTSVPASKDDE